MPLLLVGTDLIQNAWDGLIAVVVAGLLTLAGFLIKKGLEGVTRRLKETTVAQTADISTVIQEHLKPVLVDVRGSRTDVQQLRTDFQDHRDSLGRAHDELSRRVDGAIADGKKTGEVLKRVEASVNELVGRVDGLEKKPEVA